MLFAKGLFAEGKPRSALLAGASAIAFAAFGCPAAQAACSGAPQTILSLNYPGPVVGDGGVITVKSGASVAGAPTGVYAGGCGIGTLSNSGGISGAPTIGGIGVLADLNRTIGSLSNLAVATINGGSGGAGRLQRRAADPS